MGRGRERLGAIVVLVLRVCGQARTKNHNHCEQRFSLHGTILSQPPGVRNTPQNRLGVMSVACNNRPMLNSPAASPERASAGHAIGKGRVSLLVVLLVLLVVSIVLSWMTRGSMSHLPHFNSNRKSSAATSSLVDLQPWQTAQSLAAMAVSSEENEYARQAEHLADHEVDQAFAAALRQAGLDAEHRKLTGSALQLQQKIVQIEQLQKQDQALVNKLSASAKLSSQSGAGSAQSKNAIPVADALQVAKAQLGLDNDELADAQHDLDRASGDESARIQDELNAHEESMRKYDSQMASGQLAVVSVAKNRTLAARIKAWFDQRQRSALIQQAKQQALQDVSTLTAQHNALEAKANAAQSTAGADTASQLASLRDRSIEREILSIDDDRIQTEQQLASVYDKWAAQVDVQHGIVLHLILVSVAAILFILAAMLACDAAVRHLMARPGLDRRQMRTLRNVLELGIQILGVGLILLVIFGAPQQTPTLLGLATAALTFALQDYIVAFLGWLMLMGKTGIHVGDWVEINGVGGEVVEFRLMTTTLLETGALADPGLPTGRRITFMNSFAIRGVYFNFSTAGQWMWDQIAVTVPDSANIQALAQRAESVVREETSDNARRAEQEWRQGNRQRGASQVSATPVVNLRPSGSDIEMQIRYVTPAASRFEFRNRLYQHVIELLHEPEPAARTQRQLETAKDFV